MNDLKGHNYLFSKALGQETRAVERIGEGLNSRVFQIHCADGTCYVAKKYYRHKTDPRDRLRTEFKALNFLRQNSILNVPRPVMLNEENGFAIYEYVPGRKVNPDEITWMDIDSASDFLINLDIIKTRSAAENLQQASEACFSLEALLKNIEYRFSRLEALPNKNALSAELKTFLDKEVKTFFSHIQQWAKAILAKAKLDIHFELSHAERTLSPSDFGFHNALRLPDNSLVFIDFEYFGWDDPAKMINDFVLHPGMPLSLEMKKRFVDRLLGHFNKYLNIETRTYALYPLYGIKWCLILLNEFVPSDMARRDFAGHLDENVNQRHIIQLSKSRKMLSEVKVNYERSPIAG